MLFKLAIVVLVAAVIAFSWGLVKLEDYYKAKKK